MERKPMNVERPEPNAMISTVGPVVEEANERVSSRFKSLVSRLAEWEPSSCQGVKTNPSCGPRRVPSDCPRRDNAVRN